MLFPIGLLGQENTTLTELLKEAREKVYTQPEQTQKISAYILKQTENDLVKAGPFFYYHEVNTPKENLISQ
jgi:hypothetical protein